MQREDFYNDEIEDVNLREQLDKYIIHWRWFLLSIVICLTIAFLYLRYTTPIYEATTTILVKDEKKGGMLSELSVFSDLGLGGASVNNLDNEIEILKSRTIVESTVEKLNLNIALIAEGSVVDRDIYKDVPIKVNFISKTVLFNNAKVVLKCNFLTKETFEFTNYKENENIILSTKKVFKYGEKIPTSLGILVINKTNAFDENNFKHYNSISISISPVENVAESYKIRLKVEPISKTSSVVNVSISDPVQKRAEAFLDNMIRIYNEDAARDKNFISENTSRFIAGRLALIAQELDGVEQDVESFKKSNRLTDIESEAKLFIEGSNEYDKKGVETEIQLNVVSSLLDFIKTSTNSDLLPTNLITDSGDTGGLISSYNQLVLDRNRILKSATTENPSVIKLDQQITSLKLNMAESLKRLQSNLQIQNKNIQNQEGVLDSKISKIPAQERQFRVIARQQKVKEELYLYLLQKREETAISLAATEPNARVIDVAKAGRNPVSPKKKVIYLAAMLLGLLVPFGIIYADDLLDTKIKSKQDLEGKTQIPFVGDIPTSNDIEELIKAESRTSSAEAIRIVRTNLEFMLNKVPDGIAKTLFVTSTFPAEGKTFIAVNLAATFALSGRRVLLIGMDIRNPKFSEYMDVPTFGLTNYLSSADKDVRDYIIKHPGYENFFILPSGIIPPNPAELLMSKRVDQLFETLKKEYDYIIVDTAPVSLVTDTLLVAKNADTFVYIMRANVLEKRMLSIANSLYRENKLPNMCIVLNDTDSSKAYAYGYGYGPKEAKKHWFRKFFS
ncbi:polysaccharide biosynthesis tyrosine autokinase [Flavobacterium sp. ANB]|uniref:GumC family protein n=1 Tax=unclassified Flavobacterium TaxID=196869 RepID=UPI0012B9E5B3|nr:MULTISPECIES: tyrosine-protein kinase [unclassified Flavobacterium]MBF4518050.1 polysaccharide biosynthesis tyrosine autokinase [Flavobacterium sp. ANB]MTD71206.1 polysaccharide biosynthesis tyrosine autokinase [Flavobacterium sp. LC2016-13]